MISRLLAFALVFALPLAASAQVTAHEVKLSIKGLAQTTNSNDFLKPDRFTVNQKDVFGACHGAAPAKDEGIFLFLDCTNVPTSLNNNTILLMDTNPVTVLGEIGSVNFDLARFVQNESSKGLQSASVPATIEIDCDGATVEVFGIMDINFKDLDGTQCPNSASVKVTGTGTEVDVFSVDNGSSISAQKRSGAFSNDFPPAP